MLLFRSIYSRKKHPLRISRGVIEGGTHLFIGYPSSGITGWGETVPGRSEGAETAEECRSQLESFWKDEYRSRSVYEIYRLGREQGLAPCVLAGLDTALWDHKAKVARMPLYRLLGLPFPSTPTSLTLGINSPEVVAERIPELVAGTGIGALKVKLGSPEGLEADRAMFAQVIESCRPFPGLKIRVDANGGWSVEDAARMMKYLASHGVEYVEQPLPEGLEDGLPQLYKDRPLPIYVDESCRFSEDIPALAATVDGVNLKLMKCGGITEALRIIATARSFGLSTMIGCMSESGIAISAAASISGIIDHIDLDSHLNLDPDPAEGSLLSAGVVIPSERPGHGAWLKD